MYFKLCPGCSSVVVIACLSWLDQKSATWLLSTNQSGYLRPSWCVMSSKKRISQEVPSVSSMSCRKQKLQRTILSLFKQQREEDAGTYELNGCTTTNSSYMQYMPSLSECQVSRQRPEFLQGLVPWPWGVRRFRVLTRPFQRIGPTRHKSHPTHWQASRYAADTLPKHFEKFFTASKEFPTAC